MSTKEISVADIMTDLGIQIRAAEASKQKKRGLTDEERKARKRESDRKYRMAKKGITHESIHDESNRLIQKALDEGRINFTGAAEKNDSKPTKKVGKCTLAHQLHDRGLNREEFRKEFQAIHPNVPDANCDWYRNWAARQARV